MSSTHNPRRQFSSHPVSSFSRTSDNQIAPHIIERSVTGNDIPTKETESTGDATTHEITDACPYGCCPTESLGDFILRRGFFEGACSDIKIIAFNKEYKLHKLILDRSGYFSSLFNGPWNDSVNNTLNLVFDHDKNITKDSFELAIAKLYGINNSKMEEHLNLNLIAVGQYLDIPEIVCTATDQIVNSLDFDNLSKVSIFALENNYGKASERLIDSIKSILCSDGWQAGVKLWDGLPTQIVASVVGLDSFFVPSEWERALFIIKLVERRQLLIKNIKDIGEFDDPSKIIESLNTKVHLCHLTAEKLHRLENWKDLNGNNYVRPSVLRDALWMSITLQKKIATADEKTLELRLSKTSEDPPDNIESWFIPTRDETLYGTPDELNEQVLDHHKISTEDLADGKTTENDQFENLYKITKIPPFRFSVAFYGISEFDSDKRVYSKTLKYAGSYWNLYVQKMQHKKGYQMGVYIHRATSSLPSKNGLLNKDLFNRNDISETFVQNLTNLSLNENSRDSVQSFSTADEDTPEAGIDEFFEDDDEEEEDSAETSFLEYEDNRDKSSVYYVIYTPSRKIKPSLTCFISKPDLFNKSQSWGWKSNSMCTFKEDGSLAEGQDEILKFMVVLGNT